jgi:hypothetical protein
MNIPWPDGRCILCRINESLTKLGHLSKEHIIPEAIGGVLVSDFLCKPCNELLGVYESKLSEDPDLQSAISELRGQICSLYKDVLRNRFS